MNEDMKDKVVEVDVHDLYRFLIESCRYGYKRNNHLMPWGAYDDARKYLPMMLDVDKGCALRTAEQLCDECISDQLMLNFYDGLDDDCGNRKCSVEFIEFLTNFLDYNSDSLRRPYNYEDYLENVKRRENLKYRVYELDSFSASANKIRELTEEAVTKKEAEYLLYDKEMNAKDGVFNLIQVYTEKYPLRVIGEIRRIVEPKAFEGRVYSFELERD